VLLFSPPRHSSTPGRRCTPWVARRPSRVCCAELGRGVTPPDRGITPTLVQACIGGDGILQQEWSCPVACKQHCLDNQHHHRHRHPGHSRTLLPCQPVPSIGCAQHAVLPQQRTSVGEARRFFFFFFLCMCVRAWHLRTATQLAKASGRALGTSFSVWCNDAFAQIVPPPCTLRILQGCQQCSRPRRRRSCWR
jgi:hypothetical protein